MTVNEPAITVSLEGTLGTFKLSAAFAVRAKGITALFGPSGSGSRIIARVTRKSATLLKLVPGDVVIAQIKGVALLSSRAGNVQRLISKGEPT